MDLYSQWRALPGPREKLIRSARVVLGPHITVAEAASLEQLVQGTPADLLDLWQASSLAAWVRQGCRSWQQRYAFPIDALPEAFVHYVLAPVSAERQKMSEEIRLRNQNVPITQQSPWHQAVKLRREGHPAAVDYEPVSGLSWLARLDQQGLLEQADRQHLLQMKPVKVMRHSFLETKSTRPLYARFRRVGFTAPVIDVTGQYGRFTVLSSDNQRLGLYLCATIDGDRWKAVELNGNNPGVIGMPAIIGYAREVVDGWCQPETMGQWLTMITEAGQVSPLFPVASQYPVQLNLSQLLHFAAETQPERDEYTIEYWHQGWHNLPLLRFETVHGSAFASVACPVNAFLRIKCRDETATFTVGSRFGMHSMDVWSWPQSMSQVRSNLSRSQWST